MRRISGHLVLAAFLALTWFGVSSCDRLDEAAPVSSSESYQQDELSIFAPEASTSIVEDGTLTTELKDRRPGTDARKQPLLIFACLELTAEQRTAIAALLRSQQDCAKPIIDSLRASERPIIQAARDAQKAVVEQLRAGTIKRDEALAQLKQIREDLQAALESNPVRAWAREALEACRKAIFDQIRALLTAEQQVIWDEWIATGTIPCEPKPRGGRPDTTRPHPDTTRPKHPPFPPDTTRPKHPPFPPDTTRPKHPPFPPDTTRPGRPPFPPDSTRGGDKPGRGGDDKPGRGGDKPGRGPGRGGDKPAPPDSTKG